ncbi:NUDIX domain-containing protein [Luteipulveratus sp. YIM 133132]|uniref:NUDIX domain-containing protein n=1 Tax=Luteipulveratus flavus TaxID=3031728 RepID=UPI0023B18455|nr:NUDIX domain-containing protein [Luteipulveratus sp. YIM 133132]MDE9365594.1 NUDIX domain-containing protein [Luteipulveratus sp. YIM 133132]
MVAPILIAVAALVRDGRVLLAHRHPRRQAYPDAWGLVGGHVEPGELPHRTVVRECLEEIGVQVHDARPVPMRVEDSALRMHGFLVTRWDGEPVNAAPEEHDDLRWFRPGDLADVRMAHPESVSSILEALRIAADGNPSRRIAE